MKLSSPPKTIVVYPKEPVADEPKTPPAKPVTENTPALPQQEPVIEPPIDDDAQVDAVPLDDDEAFKTPPSKNADYAEKEGQQVKVVELSKCIKSQSETTSSRLGSAKKAIKELATKGFNMQTLSEAAAALGAIAFGNNRQVAAQAAVQGTTQTQSLRATSGNLGKLNKVGNNLRDTTSHRSAPIELQRDVNASAWSGAASVKFGPVSAHVGGSYQRFNATTSALTGNTNATGLSKGAGISKREQGRIRSLKREATQKKYHPPTAKEIRIHNDGKPIADQRYERKHKKNLIVQLQPEWNIPEALADGWSGTFEEQGIWDPLLAHPERTGLEPRELAPK